MFRFISFCRALFALLFISACSSSNSSHQHKLAICAIFKNEAPWLKEWVAYHHRVLKTSHFYLYNNESTDNYLEVLKPYIDQGIVELIDWDSSNPDHLAYGPFMDVPWADVQLGAYNDCLKNRALGKAKWVAMIDIDEFIVPHKGVKSFYKLLDLAEKRKKGTVSIHWRVYGTSGVASLKEGELLTEKLNWRTSDDYAWNILVKSIHQPEAVDFCLIHIADRLKPGFGAKTFKPNLVQLNHYWARTADFCEKKRSKTEENSPELFKQLNEVYDPVIAQYLPALKEAL